jgi:hypothetical protein
MVEGIAASPTEALAIDQVNQRVAPEVNAKERLEADKLRAEIRELEFRVANGLELAQIERRRSLRNSVIAWSSVVAGFIAAAGGAWGIYLQVSAYLKEYDVRVTEQLIKLVANLDSANVSERDNANLLLATYRLDAVPVLLWSLGRTKDPSATIEALREIARSKGEKKVADSILASAERTFEREAEKKWTDEGAWKVRNHIIAIGELAKSRSQQALALLQRWQAVLNNPTTETNVDRRSALRGSIQEAIKRLQ